MKKFIVSALLVVLCVTGYSSTTPNSGPKTTPPIKSSEVYIPVGKTGQLISLLDLSQISLKDFQKLTGKKIPVIINIHGGTEGQSVPVFSPFIAYVTNELGIAVLSPNVRGSSGYGKTFLKLDNGFKREESVKDIGALLDWIAKQPELDASRVAVWGGSYGGYMVLASMTNFNDRIKCGIDVVGISNFVTFLQNTEDYRKDLRRVEYGDERDPKMKEYLLKISPANNVDKITKPLFIIQGLNDPRVPASESEQMKQNMRNKGRNVWYMLAKDEGHGFRKKPNVDYMQWSVVMFLQQNLLK